MLQPAPRPWCLLAWVLLGLWMAGHAAAASSVVITRDGQPALPICLPSDASPRVKQAANQLADYLRRISGATLDVQVGDGSRGLVVGLASSFASLPFAVNFPQTPALLETYLLRSTAQGLYVLGASELSVEHAVWDLLHRLGYRHYFPGPTWEIVPSNRNLALAIDTVQSPEYLLRRLFYGYGGYMRQGGIQRFQEWCLHNRMSSDDQRASVALVTGHSYGGIAMAHEKLLAEHPEYLALVGGQRKRNKVSQKFCTSNPGLRQLMVDDAIAYFEKKPQAMSISRDPSDLGNWCQCEGCAAIGSPSNQAVLIANETAEAVAKRFGPRYVTIQAYAHHSPPPTIEVHPYVVASVATSLTRGGLTVEEMMAGWSAKGATIGVREYYSVFAWQHDLPGGARGMRLSYLLRSIRDFHERGARYMNAEACENWGPNGVGYYLASRMLWDLDEAATWNQTYDEFLTLCFGPARDSVARFYGLILDKPGVRLGEDLLARLYRCLQQAFQEAPDRLDVRARLCDLALYVRYIELYGQYQQGAVEEGGAEVEATDLAVGRQAAFEQLLRYAWRIGTTGMIDTIAVWRDVPVRNKAVKLPPEAALAIAEPKNLWKSSEPYREEQVLEFVSRGVAEHQPFDFEPVTFSDDLVPARTLGPGAAMILEKTAGKSVGGASQIGGAQRGRFAYFLWLDKPGPVTVQVATGLLYRDRGNLSLQLFAADDMENPLSQDESTPPDGQLRTVTLQSPHAGLHRLVVDNGNDRSQIIWPEGLPVTTTSPQGTGRWGLYFYVPRGTREVIAYTRYREGQVIGPDGKVALDLTKLKPPTFFRIPVPPGHDGQLWKLHYIIGLPELLNVPIYLARNLDDMLLPREVVEADSRR